MKITLGFIGRLDEATSEQEKALAKILKSLREQEVEYLCGGRDGSAKSFINFVIKSYSQVDLPLPDLFGEYADNRAEFLINESDLLIVMPPTCHMPRKSTHVWDAARYAWKKKSADKIKIILPDGQVLSNRGHFE